jgi:hypothetical protein
MGWSYFEVKSDSKELLYTKDFTRDELTVLFAKQQA